MSDFGKVVLLVVILLLAFVAMLIIPNIFSSVDNDAYITNTTTNTTLNSTYSAGTAITKGMSEVGIWVIFAIILLAIILAGIWKVLF
jgi:hypothetical protein